MTNKRSQYWKMAGIILFLLITFYTLQNSNHFWTWITFCVVMYLGGVYLYGVIIKPRLHRTMFMRFPLSKIEHMAIGQVMLQGHFILETDEVLAPYGRGKCIAYHCQYYKGTPQKDGMIKYHLDDEINESTQLSFEDETDKIILDNTCMIQPLDDWRLEEIKQGNDLIKLRILQLDIAQQYMIVGRFQITTSGDRVIQGDGQKKIYCMDQIQSENVQLHQRHLQLFQRGKIYGIITALLVIVIGMMFYQPSQSVPYLPILWIHFVGSLVLAFIISKMHRVKGMENFYVNVITLAWMPNVGVIVLGMLFSIGLLALFLSMMTVFIASWLFVQQNLTELQIYWNDKQNTKGQL